MHTFHFQFREMTITTLDFATIMGFASAGLWIHFDIPKDLTGICHDLMGCLFEFKIGRGSLISYDQLWRAYDGVVGDGVVGIKRHSWSFIFYLMSMVVFPNLNNTGDSWLLLLLEDLDVLWYYDWGSTAYSYILHSFDDACRGSSRIYSVPLVVDVSYFRCFAILFPSILNALFLIYFSYRFRPLSSVCCPL